MQLNRCGVRGKTYEDALSNSGQLSIENIERESKMEPTSEFITSLFPGQRVPFGHEAA
jgi:hypothetical protein